MEFESNDQPQIGNGMSSDDAAHLAATEKRIVIEPISTTITPETLSAEQIAAEHANGPAIANAPTDTERTVASAATSRAATQPTPTRIPRHTKTISFIVGLLALVGGTTLVLVVIS